MRSLKDLERSAATLAAACKVVLDNSINDGNVRARLSNELPRITLEKALEEVTALIRPANDVYYLALEERYRSVRFFLPDLLKHIRFGFSPAGKGVAASLVWLQLSLPRRKPEDDAPQEIVAKAWQQHITREEGSLDMSAYVFCTLDALPAAMSLCHPIGVMPTGVSACSLGLTIDAKITLDALSVELDATWQAVAARLRDNPAIQFSENADGKTELSLGALGRPAALGRFAQARPSAGEPHHANAANRGSSAPSDPVAGRIRTNREDVAHADVHR